LLRAECARRDATAGGIVKDPVRKFGCSRLRKFGCSSTLAEAGIAPSVGSRGDSYDNALAESVIGLFKTEVIRRRGPWRHLEDVEFATLEWVAWFNTRRLLEPLGYVPPAEYEAAYYRRQDAPAALATLT